MVESTATELEFSPVNGGPFYRVLRARGWVGPDGWKVFRISLLLIAIGWLPMILLALIEWRTTRALDPVVLDPAVHARLVVAIPLLIAAAAALDNRCATATKRFVGGQYTGQMNLVERLFEEVKHERDSKLPEAVMAVVALGVGQAAIWGWTGWRGLLYGFDIQTDSGWPPCRLWYSTFALPLFQFLLLRTMWSWLLWSRVLWGLSSADPQPVPTHPDHAGGLAYLAEPPIAFAIAVLAGSSVVAASWLERTRVAGATLQSLSVGFVGLCIMALVIALGPLLFFSKCRSARGSKGYRQYSQLALTHSRLFHRR